MPRTKRVLREIPQGTVNNDQIKSRSKRLAAVKELILGSAVPEEEKRLMDYLKKPMEEQLAQLHIEHLQLKCKFSGAVLSCIVSDIKSGLVSNENSSLSTTVTSNLTHTFNTTRTMSSTKSTNKTASIQSIRSAVSKVNRTRQHNLRSSSVGADDEGYTTAESDRATNSGERKNGARPSRTLVKKSAVKRQTRSLSRTAGSKNTHKTPLQRQISACSSGLITPKCKPDTPLMFVRQPKVGEISWSNQGSPLLASTVVENTANINIPLRGGTTLAMLPQRGAVRESMIPDMDESTLNQLKVLRDQLVKVLNIKK